MNVPWDNEAMVERAQPGRRVRSAIALVFGVIVAACDVGTTGDDPLALDRVAETFGESLCESARDCGCERPVFVDDAECRSASSEQFDDMFARAQARSLQYDRTCAQRAAETWEKYGCRTPNELSVDGDLHDPRRPCSLFHGHGRAGDACTASGGFSDCAQGLTCAAGRCAAPGGRCLNPLGTPDPNAPMMCALFEALHSVAPGAGEGSDCHGDAVPGTAGVGDALADWNLTDSDGVTRRLHDFCDEAVLLVAAATWCLDCVTEADDVERVHQQYADRGLRVVTLLGQSLQGAPATPADAAEWKQTLALDHLVVADPDFEVAARYFSTGVGIVLPAAMLLRPGSVVVSNNAGDELERVEEALP